MRNKGSMHWMKLWPSAGNLSFLIIIFFMTNILQLHFTLLFCSQSHAEDNLHFGLVGQWNNDYGYFNTVKIREYGEEIIKKYAFCATDKGIVIFDIVSQSIASFFSLTHCH